MNQPSIPFHDNPAVREKVPLLLGIAGCSGSGKTYSMLELLTGMQEIIGGDIYIIDTEHKRALFYAEIFKFRHVPFDPPFSPLRYLEAIEYCRGRGAGIIGIDSMTHEHSGEGGVMDQSESYLDKKCKEDEGCRKRNFMLSMVGPKAQRKKLNSRIVQMGVNAVFCYRAFDKVKPVSGQEPVKLGWQPEGTSPLIYDMAQMFLLGPGSEGRPTFTGETQAEKMMIKSPAQFRDWFKDGQQLNRAMGRRMAEWAAGKVSSTPPKAQERGAATNSSGEPPNNPNAFKQFLDEMAALKEKDQEIYYRVLGANGFTHANEIRKVGLGTRIKSEIQQAIDERESMKKQ